MGHRKERNLLRQMANQWLLERAADEAYQALDDKEVWYAKAYKSHEQESIERVRQMILANKYPEKEYRPRKHMADGKEREIFRCHSNHGASSSTQRR